MAEEWEQQNHKGSEGLGKDIKTCRGRQNMLFDKPHGAATRN